MRSIPWEISSYCVRFAVMGPDVKVFLYNQASVVRKVTVSGYLVA